LAGFLPALHHGPAGTLALLARVPGEGQDVSGLARSRDRMLSAVTGGENILFKVVDDTVCLILIHEQSLKRTRGL